MNGASDPFRANVFKRASGALPWGRRGGGPVLSKPLEILTVAQCAEADRAAEGQGVAVRALMERAGEAVARAVLERFPDGPVTVLAGPGNNGGDGFVAARVLKAKGRIVRVLCEPEAPGASEAARAARAAWDGETGPLTETFPADGAVVDALFGAGLARPLEGAALALAHASQPHRRRVLAVDVPSGVHGDTGRSVGEAAFVADATVTFHRMKPAHVLTEGREACGEILLADIGLPEAATPAATLHENTPELWLERYPWPKPGGHKHSRGRMGVVSGKVYDTGAARLAARAGLRAGAGTVRVYCPPEAALTIAAHLEAVMLKPFEDDDELAGHAQALDSVVIGPAAGLDDATVANLEAVAETGAALVVDADCLTIFKDRPQALFAILDRDDVITPHTGEFERLFPGLLKSAPERIAAAREACRRAGCVVVLKGFDTVIAAPDGRTAVNTNATPWLGTAGSGDVLAGIVGALLAQNMDSFDAACAAVWLHAEAGSGFGPGLIAEDLPDLLPPVLARLWRASQGGGR